MYFKIFRPSIRIALLMPVLFIGHAFAGQEALVGLHSLIEKAVASHPSVAAKQSGIAAAQEGVAGARWQYWPTPSLSIERPNQALLVGNDKNVTTFALKQPVWTGGKLDADLAMAEAALRVSRASKEEMRQELALQVIQAYANYLTAKIRSDAYSDSLKVHKELLEQVRRRSAEGLSAMSDVSLAQSRLNALNADLAYSEAQQSMALEKLASLVGNPLDKNAVDTKMVIFQLRTIAPIFNLSKVLSTDPSLVRLQAESEQLKAQADSSVAVLSPQMYVSMVRRNGDITGGNTQYFVGIQSNIGAGLSAMSAARASEQRVQAKQGEIAARTRNLNEQAQSDVQLMNTSHGRVLAFESSLVAAKEVSESWSRQFVAGKKAWQEVMNAEREIAQTHAQLADALGALLLAQWRLAVLTEGVDGILGAFVANK